MPVTTTRKVELAHDVLSIAASTTMTEIVWTTDPRIARACEVLALTPAVAWKKRRAFGKP